MSRDKYQAEPVSVADDLCTVPEEFRAPLVAAFGKLTRKLNDLDFELARAKSGHVVGDGLGPDGKVKVRATEST